MAAKLIALCGRVWCSTLLASPPNLLLIIADDLGYGDLGCTGSQTIATPNIDALAASGTFFSQGYVASAVCSPSRAGLMTGRDPRRFGYEGNLNNSAGNYSTRPELLGLSPTEHTLADHLRAAGYATALIGKWHLGDAQPFHPNRRGFEYFCGMLNGSHEYFVGADSKGLERNGAPLRRFSNPYLTDFFTDEAIKQIDKQGDRPWMMMLSYNAPHTPLQATKADLQACKHIEDPQRRTYAAMVVGLDRGVGRVIEHLEETGERDNTLIVFLSDNGGATDNHSWNGPLSGAKGCMLEGGVRVPMFWSWPGKVQSGRTSDAVASSLDILPTFLAAAGAEALELPPRPSHEDKTNQPAGNGPGALDGVSLLPHLVEGESLPERRLFWRLQGQAAVLDGQYKLTRPGHRPAQLFRPATDPGERDDLAASESDQVRAMYKLLGDWEASLGTVPLWDSSPYWWGASARIYDSYDPRPEPK
ncbi:Arylsulfatase [Pirellulimonas nuda]|uniref:Arylsulfatase n=1 Tax=Pirellulimonas nuda TaxID=2528009 RepID=A0A518DBH6_9BACT|nr:sulfatase-like hydrolase/transferase [Pirellulimonas nuda]QDU88835.1 Arylsulfatase [Pirellulimonas nuda]